MTLLDSKKVKDSDDVIPRHPPSLEQAKGVPIPMMNYSFGGDGETFPSSDFQGRGSPSTNDVLVSGILKLAA